MAISSGRYMTTVGRLGVRVELSTLASRYGRTCHNHSSKAKIVRNFRHCDHVISIKSSHAHGFQKCMRTSLALADRGLPRIMGLGQKLNLSRLSFPLCAI